MTLSLQNMSGLLQSMSAAAQGACSQLLDFTTGSVLRALTQGAASMGLWLQWLIVLLMNRQRLATCFGDDVDTFVGDFGLARLPGVASSGTVTLTWYYHSSSTTILVGSTVLTGDGSQTFTIIADTTNSYWNASVTNPAGQVVGGFVIPGGTTTANLTVQNTVAGSSGNVSAGTINLIGTAGIADLVTNAVAFTNGLDAESDTALKVRFQNYIASLSKGTLGAIEAAVLGVQQGLTCNVAINVDTSGAYRPGNFVVTVDNGTGSPPGSLLTQVSTAIEQVRSLCESYNVQGPTLVNAAIVCTITVASGYVKANLIGSVQTALTAYVNGLPVGAPLPFSKIASVVYAVSPGITNVSAITLNGGTSDITGGPSDVIRVSPAPVVN